MSVKNNIKTFLIVIALLFFSSNAIYGDDVTIDIDELSNEETINQVESTFEDDKDDVLNDLVIINDDVTLIEQTTDDNSSDSKENVTVEIEDKNEVEVNEETSIEEISNSQEEIVSDDAIENDDEPIEIITDNVDDNTSLETEIINNALDTVTLSDATTGNENSVSNEASVSTLTLITFSGNQKYTISEATLNGGIKIKNLELAQMPTNNDYSYLSFSFSSDDNTVYECYIAGFNISYLSEDGLRSGIEQLAYDIANSYYNNRPLYIANDYTYTNTSHPNRNCSAYNTYGIVIDPIDAEKTHLSSEYESSNGDTDSQLCWAASSSDMIEFAGWNDTTGLNDEDAVFDYFEKSYTDDGSTQDKGNKWFMNGVYYTQSVSETGDIIYGSFNGSAQEKLVNETKNGNLVPNYAEELVGTQNNIEAEKDYDQFYQSVIDIKNGYATGLGVYFFDSQGKQVGGHAITLAGYLRDTSKEGIDSLCALFVSDSDNDKYYATDTNTHVNRSEIPNSISMLELKRNEVMSWSGNINGVSLVNYVQEPYNASILYYSTLAPKTSANQVDDDGTKNALNTIDMVVTDVVVCDDTYKLLDSAYIGDTVRLYGLIQNRSYTKLSLENHPYFNFSFIVECDDQYLDTVGDTMLVYDNGTGFYAPLESNSIWFKYALPKEGTYKIYAVYNWIAYNEENPIREAYTSNNVSNKIYTLIVKAREIITNYANDDSDDEIEVIVPKVVKKNINKNSKNNVAVYTAIIQSDKKDSTKVELKNIKTKIASISLVGVGDIKNQYTLIYAKDGTVSIKFNDDFIKALKPGKYTFNLFDKNQEIIASVEVEVNVELTDTSSDDLITDTSETTNTVEDTEPAQINNAIFVINNIVSSIQNFFKGILKIFIK